MTRAQAIYEHQRMRRWLADFYAAIGRAGMFEDLAWLIFEKKETYKIAIFRSSSRKEVKLPSRAIDAMIELEDCGFKFYWIEEEKAYMIIPKKGEVKIIKDKWAFLLEIQKVCENFHIYIPCRIDN